MTRLTLGIDPGKTERKARALSFQIVGNPAPQGSKRHVGGNRMVESSKFLPAWRADVAAAAQAQRAKLDSPLAGPLELVVTFRFPMPKSRKKAERDRGIGWKVAAPDLDKLLRGLGDGLESGGLIDSDALIVSVTASKVEVVGDWSGAVVAIRELVAPPVAALIALHGVEAGR